MINIVHHLLEKSKEAFILAIEIYNKPTIKYRLEGFSFFICNAWELMLKAHIIMTYGEDKIFYQDKPNRTLSLENCIQKIFTNEKSPLRLNLAKIIELRNTSTHFITEEYEMVYIPLLQACVFNFIEKMKEFHSIDMTEIIPENFINLSIKISYLDDNIIKGKYTSQIAERLISMNKNLSSLIDQNNSNFAIRVVHNYYNTKNKNEATELYHIDNTSTEGIRILKEYKNPNDTHKYTQKKAIEIINARLSKDNIKLMLQEKEIKFNRYHFNLFTSYYGIKNNDKFCFVHTVPAHAYSYSQQAIEFIINEIKKDPKNIIENLKKQLNKKS